VNLLIEVLAQVALQLGDGLAAQAGGNGFRITGFHVLIKNFFGIDKNERAGGARSEG